MENPNIVYGILTESIHISGYSLKRFLKKFEWILEENRWREVDKGFDNINDFLGTIDLSEFKLAIEQRKGLSTKLAKLKASQRATAKALGVSKDTIRNDIGEKSPLEKNIDIEYEEVKEDNGEKSPHVSHNSGENEWYTPSEYIECARNAMKGIDLDPATSLLANETVKAGQIFTKEDNGLNQKWSGNIWLNPPYAQPLINEFSDKLVSELPNMKQACVLVNNATETNWFQNMLDVCNAVCFLKGRVKYIDMNGEATGAPLQGQVILYFGESIKEFHNNFNEMGICMTRMN